MPSELPLVVRAAALDDAPEVMALVRESILKLCVLDHQNDGETLGAWLSNKTPEHFARWLADRSGHLVVASSGAERCGVGSIHESGDIRLCYVRVGWQRRGVGRALMEALEAKARSWGLAEVRLSSSSAARPFYEQQAYRANGEALPAFGVLRSYPYVKSLAHSRGSRSSGLEGGGSVP